MVSEANKTASLLQQSGLMELIMNILSILAIAACVTLSAPCAMAQDAEQEMTAHVHKQDLQTIDYPAGHQTLMIRTSIDVHGTMPPHTHPGVEAGYVLQGSGTLKVAGRPDQALMSGASFIVPPETVHSLVNTGDTEIVVLTSYVVKQGKPLVTLVK